MDNEYILGIDFGTTFCSMGVWKNGCVKIIPNMINERIIPSVVEFNDKGKVFVGEETINRIYNEDSVKIYEIKRFIGKKYYEVKNILNYYSYKIVKGCDDEILISIEFRNGKKIIISPEDIAFLLFNKLILNAEIFLSININQVIIAVPSDFSDRQRSTIKMVVGQIKGLKVLKIINEPSAVVLSYGIPIKFMKKDIKIINEKILKEKVRYNKIIHPLEEIDLLENINNNLEKEIVDNLNRTSFKNTDECLKIIVFDLGSGTYDVSLIEYGQNIFETIASAGNSSLGGSDFDNRLMEYCLNDFYKKNKDITMEEINYKCKQRLKIACEQTKKYLSIKMEDSIFIEDFYKGKTLNCKISRNKFEDICQNEFNKLIPPLERVLFDSKIKPEEINEIILTGGSSKIPKIKQIIKRIFPKVIINDSINPKEAVAYGSVIFGESERKKEGDFWEDFDYLDSIQHSYGIEVDNGKMEFILRRGSKYPTSNTKYYFTLSNYQKNFEIKIYEGENEYVKDNEFLDEFIVNGIPRRKKGEVCLAVTFTVDKNQMLNITGYVGEGNIKKEIEIRRKNKKYKINSLISINNDLDDIVRKEKQIKEEIIEYSKKFKNTKENKEKLLLIKKYDEAILFSLKLLEDNNLNSYYNYVEKLYQSYAYIHNSELFLLLEKKEKYLIKENILKYLKKIVKDNPYKVKELLIKFKYIDIQKSSIFYEYSILSMNLLLNLAKEYLSKNEDNSICVAKNLCEESISIAVTNLYLKDKEKYDDIFSKINNGMQLKMKYKEIVNNCYKEIFFILMKSSQVIYYTIKNDKLFSSKEKIDLNKLSLISSYFEKSFEEFDNFEGNTKDKFKLGFIYCANLVIFENKLDLKKLLKYLEKRIKKIESLGIYYTKTEWFKELIKTKSAIEKKLE